MKFIKIFVAASAIFGLQFTLASAASPVKVSGTSISTIQQTHQEPRHHITRHHLRHRPHRLRHK